MLLETESCPSCGRCPCLTSSNNFTDLLATKLPRPFDKGKLTGFKDLWWHPVIFEVLDIYYDSIQVIVEKKAVVGSDGQTWVQKEVFIPDCADNYCRQLIKVLYSQSCDKPTI